MFPNPPSDLVTNADRVLSDPCSENNQPIISDVQSRYIFSEEEETLVTIVTKEKKGMS